MSIQPQWFHDNSNSIFLSSGMSSKSSIHSLPVRTSGWVEYHIYTNYTDICLVAWRCQGLYHCSIKWFLRTIRNTTGEQSRLCYLFILQLLNPSQKKQFIISVYVSHPPSFLFSHLTRVVLCSQKDHSSWSTDHCTEWSRNSPIKSYN